MVILTDMDLKYFHKKALPGYPGRAEFLKEGGGISATYVRSFVPGTRLT